MANIETITVGSTTYGIGGMGSYVGMIIHSTTLDTMAKVIEKYGGTTWIQHSDYVLRGATSGVTDNDATKTGGSDDAVVISHTHGAANNYGFIIVGASGSGSSGNMTTGTRTVSVSSNTASAGEDGTNKNIPNYKSVYIWERTA